MRLCFPPSEARTVYLLATRLTSASIFDIKLAILTYELADGPSCVCLHGICSISVSSSLWPWSPHRRQYSRISSSLLEFLLRVYCLTSGDGKRKPGMVRVREGGKAFLLELWDIPLQNVGAFLQKVRTCMCVRAYMCTFRVSEG